MSHAEVRALPVVVPLWPDAARAWGMSRWAVYDGASRGQLPFKARRVGRKWVVTRADLLRSLGLDPESGEQSASA